MNGNVGLGEGWLENGPRCHKLVLMPGITSGGEVFGSLECVNVLKSLPQHFGSYLNLLTCQQKLTLNPSKHNWLNNIKFTLHPRWLFDFDFYDSLNVFLFCINECKYTILSLNNLWLQYESYVKFFSKLSILVKMFIKWNNMKIKEEFIPGCFFWVLKIFYQKLGIFAYRYCTDRFLIR